jgi:hypothetical protein
VRAQRRDFVRAADHTIQPHAMAQERRRPQRDVPAADQQYPEHPIDPIPEQGSGAEPGVRSPAARHPTPMQIIIKPSDHSFDCAARSRP